MPIRLGVAIGSFGDDDVWTPLVKRAVKSVLEQTVHCEFRWVHGENLRDARNEAGRYLAEEKNCEWLIFLDADDELDSQFVEHMENTINALPPVQYPILQPSCLGVVDGVEDDAPVLLEKKKELLIENYLILGCVHKAEMFHKIGGFEDYSILEDWDYWLKAEEIGSMVFSVKEAIYRINIDTERKSRNKAMSEYDTENMIKHVRHMSRVRREDMGIPF